MKRFFVSSSFALTLSLLAIPATAADGWYVSGSAGVAALDESSSKGTITGGSTTGDVDFNFGVGLAGSVGYALENIRLEGEVSYRKNDLDDVTVNTVLVGTSLFTNLGTVALSGDVSALAFMANAFYDFNAGEIWTPFLMAGIGAVKIDLDAISVDGVAVTYDESDTVFAYQIGVGIGYNLATKTTVNIQYRFMGTTDPSFDDGTVVIDGEYRSHSLWVGFTQRF